MISKKLFRTIKSLDKRKYRQQEGLFVAEGAKVVDELMNSLPARCIVAVEEWINEREHAICRDGTICETVSKEELERISLQRHPQDVIALFELPKWEARIADVARSELVLALDGVQDPGNLGTIIRVADWFGIEHVFCANGTADVFNPKALQATMGALGRVQVHYTDLVADLSGFAGNVFGTFLSGVSIHEATLSRAGVIIMGNEGSGISPALAKLATSRLFIPPYPCDRDRVESLNVAIATAIVCAEFRR